MESETHSLYARITVLEKQLQAAIREKEVAETSLLHILDLIFRGKLEVKFTSKVPDDLLDLDIPELQQGLAEVPQVAEQKENSLLDGPPILDLDMRGMRTHHDEIDGVYVSGDSNDRSSKFTPESGESSRNTSFSGDLVDRRGESKMAYPGPSNEAKPKTTPQPTLPFFQIAPINPRILPLFFTYGIRYSPKGNFEKVSYRVLLTNLPVGLPIHVLMSKIRGGMVVSCVLLDTESTTGTWSALVRFRNPDGPSAFKNFAIKNQLKFKDQPVFVRLLGTPSYPLSVEERKNIFIHHHTRCLRVKNFKPKPEKLHRLLGSKVERNVTIEYIEKSADNVLTVRFTAVRYASQAFEVFRSRHEIMNRDISFTPDPCAASDDDDPFETGEISSGEQTMQDVEEETTEETVEETSEGTMEGTMEETTMEITEETMQQTMQEAVQECAESEKPQLVDDSYVESLMKFSEMSHAEELKEVEDTLCFGGMAISDEPAFEETVVDTGSALPLSSANLMELSGVGTLQKTAVVGSAAGTEKGKVEAADAGVETKSGLGQSIWAP